MSWLTTYPSKKSITNLLASRISFLLSLPLILGTIGCGGDDPVTTDESAEKTPASEVDSTDITDGNLDEGLAPDPVEPDPEESEPLEVPDPNGVFLPMYDEKDGKMEMVKIKRSSSLLERGRLLFMDQWFSLEYYHQGWFGKNGCIRRRKLG